MEQYSGTILNLCILIAWEDVLNCGQFTQKWSVHFNICFVVVHPMHIFCCPQQGWALRTVCTYVPLGSLSNMQRNCLKCLSDWLFWWPINCSSFAHWNWDQNIKKKLKKNRSVHHWSQFYTCTFPAKGSSYSTANHENVPALTLHLLAWRSCAPAGDN